MRRPASFDEASMSDWSIWVLGHGLPKLPMKVRHGEAIPVACWAGTSSGTVLYVTWREFDEDDGPYLDTEVELLVPTPSGWDLLPCGGGSNWTAANLGRPAWIAPDEVHIGGSQSCRANFDDGRYTAIEGFVGQNVGSIELRAEGRLEQRPIDSPIGAFIVSTTSAVGVELTFRGHDGQIVSSSAIAT